MKARQFIALSCIVLLPAMAYAGAAQKPILDSYLAAAKAENVAFSGFSAERGKAFFLAKHEASADTPSYHLSYFGSDEGRADQGGEGCGSDGGFQDSGPFYGCGEGRKMVHAQLPERDWQGVYGAGKG